MTRVSYGVVEVDTHNAYGYKRVVANAITRKLYPEAKEKDGKLLVKIDGATYTVPVSGMYEITTGVNGWGMSYMAEIKTLQKGEQLHFSRQDNTYLQVVKVK